jgi:hypothetical protein
MTLIGSCLWLALTVFSKPHEIEARHDRNTTQWERKSVPQALASDGQAGRLMTEITDISDFGAEQSAVVQAIRRDEDAAKLQAIEVIGHLTEQSEHESDTLSGNGSSAAWLTGTIEHGDSESAGRLESLTHIPAWKRTSKSLKRSLRAASLKAQN